MQSSILGLRSGPVQQCLRWLGCLSVLAAFAVSAPGCEHGPDDDLAWDDEQSSSESFHEGAEHGAGLSRVEGTLGFGPWVAPAPRQLTAVQEEGERSSTPPDGTTKAVTKPTAKAAQPVGGGVAHGDPHPWNPIDPAGGDPHPWVEGNPNEDEDRPESEVQEDFPSAISPSHSASGPN